LGKKRADENRVAELERKNRPAGVGDRFVETVLAAHRRTADAAGVNWKGTIYQQVRQEMRTKELAIERMCELASVSRRGFYRFDPDVKPAERDMDLRDAITNRS
jgi:hypothetical protein